MVRMSVLNDALKSIVNAEKSGKRQVNPSLFSRNSGSVHFVSILLWAANAPKLFNLKHQASLLLI